MKAVRKFIHKVWLYAAALGKWLILAAVTGEVCGLIGSAFHIGVGMATQLREQHPWLLFCLPVSGLAIAAIYRLLHTEGQGTNDIIDAVHLGKRLSILLLPSIFLGTILTHLCGGSAGREGAALQMGGTIGYWSSKLFHLDDRDTRTATLCVKSSVISWLSLCSCSIFFRHIMRSLSACCTSFFSESISSSFICAFITSRWYWS